MKTAFKIIGGLLVLVVLVALGTYLWASRKSTTLFARTIPVHSVDFAIPFPLPDSEVTRLRITKDSADILARARAAERGRHLVESRYAVRRMPQPELRRGVMVDEPILGRFLGPNLTLGRGSRTLTYRAADWDHIVRHGILPGGKPAGMPSQDFARMSDQELSDIVSYIRSFAPVDSEVPHITLGPLGKMLVATGQLPMSVDLIEHSVAHAAYPPVTEATAAFGKHIATTCSGCHRPDFSGGPIQGGDPAWPPAGNLTPHADALGRWTLEQFKTTLRTATRPDGTALKPPMNGFMAYANKMSDVELEALWKYLQSLPAVAPTAK